MPFCNPIGYHIAKPPNDCDDAGKTKIATLNECKDAAKVLGINWNPKSGESDKEPSGCLFRIPDNDILFNNKKNSQTSLEAAGDRKDVCLDTPDQKVDEAGKDQLKWPLKEMVFLIIFCIYII